MPIETQNPDQIPIAGQYLEWILGGGATSFLTILFLYHKYIFLPKTAEILSRSTTLGKTIKHERDERKKLDPKLKQLQTEIHAEKAAFVDFMEWYNDFKKSTEIEIERMGTREEQHYKEVIAMQTEDKLLHQEMSFLKEKVTKIESSIETINSSINKLSELLMQQLMKDS